MCTRKSGRPLAMFVKLLQMPATRPIVAQTASAVKADEVKETQRPPAQVGAIPFTMRYDKLVIAVGAYSQSQ